MYLGPMVTAVPAQEEAPRSLRNQCRPAFGTYHSAAVYPIVVVGLSSSKGVPFKDAVGAVPLGCLLCLWEGPTVR